MRSVRIVADGAVSSARMRWPPTYAEQARLKWGSRASVSEATGQATGEPPITARICRYQAQMCWSATNRRIAEGVAAREEYGTSRRSGGRITTSTAAAMTSVRGARRVMHEATPASGLVRLQRSPRRSYRARSLAAPPGLRFRARARKVHSASVAECQCNLRRCRAGPQYRRARSPSPESRDEHQQKPIYASALPSSRGGA